MTVPRASTAAPSSSPSLPRSNEGRRADSSAHPLRRSQRASLPTTPARGGRTHERWDRPQALSPLPPALVADLTQVLQQRRAFRIDQLTQLDSASDARSDPVRREVDATLRDAARVVLNEIDAALRRIDMGSFGRCRRCGEVMSLEWLIELPTSMFCRSCQKRNLAPVEVAPAAIRGEAARSKSR